MAITSTVCQLRSTSYTASANNAGGMKSATIGFSKRFLVEFKDDADDDFQGSQVTELNAAYANGIPLVNYHTWYDPNTGLGYPLAVCNSKTVTRLENNSAAFYVDVTFQTESSGSSSQGNGPDKEDPEDVPTEPPADVSDISAKVTRAIQGREIVLYEAPAYGSNNNFVGNISTRLIPSFNGKLRDMFDAPVTRTKPLLNITITQFEDEFTNQTMMDRCFKVNGAAWAGFVSKSCMITHINAVKQSVTMKDGDDVVDSEKFRVTYTILFDDYSVSNSTGPLFVGHAAALPLISRSYINVNNSNKPSLFYVDELAYGNVGLTDIDGRDLEDQTGRPDYVRFDTVDEISFDFLPTTIE